MKRRYAAIVASLAALIVVLAATAQADEAPILHGAANCPVGYATPDGKCFPDNTPTDGKCPNGFPPLQGECGTVITCPPDTLPPRGYICEVDFNEMTTLIIVPPITTGNEVLTNAPYSQWQETDSYHGYNTCLQELQQFKNQYVLQVLLRNGGGVDLGLLAAPDATEGTREMHDEGRSTAALTAETEALSLRLPIAAITYRQQDHR